MTKIILIALVALSLSSCGNNEAELAKLQQQRSIDSMEMVLEQQQMDIAQQKAIDSMAAIVVAKEAAARSNRSTRSSGSTQYVQSNSARTEPAAPVEAKRKGWSGAAKGAVIGAGVGAVSGALIDEKKGRGAIIGGVAGAGIGAGTGAIVDDAKKKKK